MRAKIKKIVHHLRQQPEKDKKHILHLFTLIFAVTLIILWAYSLGSTISNSDTKVEIKNDMKPFSALKNNLVDGYNSVSDQ